MSLRTLSLTTELPIKIDAVEEKLNAHYVGDFCIKDSNGNYVERTVAIFWQPIPPVEGYSHYFGVFVRSGAVYITDGSTAFDSPIVAIEANDGEWVYSRHRWDCRQSADGSVMIDGGRDYTRLVGQSAIGARQAHIKVIGPTAYLVITPEDQQEFDRLQQEFAKCELS